MITQGIANTWTWLGFSIFLIVALTIDNIVMRNPKYRPSESLRSAWVWSCVWISSALIFNLLLWFYLKKSNPAQATEISLSFLTGYVIEKSLSVDNLFVFYMIFRQFHIPLRYQQRVFSYGIWSAVVLRLVLILLGSWLIAKFNWLLYVLGAFLVLTGIKMLFMHEHEKDLAGSRLYGGLRRFFRLTTEIQDQHFFIRKNKLFYATPLFVALVFIEFSDIIFAFDSIPAIFAITTDPFIVWTSNIFAILGLRALYFLLAGMIQRFSLLKYAIALILVFVGIKMLAAYWYHIPVTLSLCVITGLLIFFGLLSMRSQNRMYN